MSANATPKNPFDLTGKVALITGGNSGLGLAFAQGIAAAGADVVLWGRRTDKNEEAAQQVRKHGTKVATFAVDVSREDEVVDGIHAAVSEMGRIDSLVANAGISTPVSSVIDLDTDRYRELLAINLDGAFFALRETARHMVERAKAGDAGGSLIVNGSTSAVMGVPGIPHYAAAKGGLLAMVRSLAVDLGPWGIRANMVAPGYTVTNLNRSPEQAVQRAATDAKVQDRTPLGRLGRPEDITGSIVYLMSDAAAFHSGDLLKIDGAASINLM